MSTTNLIARGLYRQAIRRSLCIRALHTYIPSRNLSSLSRAIPHASSTSTTRLSLLPATKEQTPNENSLKFLPGVNVLDKGSMEFPNRAAAASSPLAKALFAIEGVKLVYFTKHFISVNKDPEMDWEELKPAIFGAIVEFYSSGKPIVSEEKPREDTMIKEGDSDVVQAIKEILETRVRPSVQQDGGDIEYKGFEDGIVLLKMQGSCSGCSSSSVTLKSGIERMLMHYVPEVNGVVAVSDDDLDKVNLEAFTKVEKSSNAAAH